jgi:hypothetical protein
MLLTTTSMLLAPNDQWSFTLHHEAVELALAAGHAQPFFVVLFVEIEDLAP